jgi:hypothetical protein
MRILGHALLFGEIRAASIPDLANASILTIPTNRRFLSLFMFTIFERRG